jgi:hypothetical protein
VSARCGTSMHLVRYIIHLENLKYSPREANLLLKSVRRVVSVQDTRVASRLVEFETCDPENIRPLSLILAFL